MDPKSKELKKRIKAYQVEKRKKLFDNSTLNNTSNNHTDTSADELIGKPENIQMGDLKSSKDTSMTRSLNLSHINTSHQYSQISYKEFKDRQSQIQMMVERLLLLQAKKYTALRKVYPSLNQLNNREIGIYIEIYK